MPSMTPPNTSVRKSGKTCLLYTSIFSMSYSIDLAYPIENASAFVRAIGDDAFYSAGLSAFSTTECDILLGQTDGCFRAGSNGVNFFSVSYTHLNYFHISIDELFGYNSDRDERIKSILERATKILTNQGFKMYTGSLPQEVEDCVNMLRAASEEFPNESKILLKFAQSLTMWGWRCV